MPLVYWANSTSPIVTLSKEPEPPRPRFEWSPTTIFMVEMADTLRIKIAWDHNDVGDLETEVNVYRLTEDGIRCWPTLKRIDKTIDPSGGDEREQSENVDLPIEGRQLFRFRVCCKSLESRTMAGTEYWEESEKDFLAFVQYAGDFSLDYIPITLLYCPPEQDMTNALMQTTDYQTVVSIGTSELLGSEDTISQSVKGGVSIQTPYVGAGQTVGGGSTSTGGSSLENLSRNSIAFRYTWNTRLVADNQRAIGRAYWGPLGDLFVLLKNPWFTLIGGEEGLSLAVNEQKTETDTELLILPAHKLLRPGSDPVANQIPAEARRRLLELDPFITNLDLFFSPTGDGSGELEDLGIPLEWAADPYANPSPGNRAALLATYGLSAGVILDLSATEEVKVTDTTTQETVYYGRVTDTVDLDTSLNFLAGIFTFGSHLGHSGSEYTRVSYLASNETRGRFVKTAQCSLIRNQNAVDLSDIEIWWDKHFSTFMFRKRLAATPVINGRVFDTRNNVLRNAEVHLVLDELHQKIAAEEGSRPAYDRLLELRGIDVSAPLRRPRTIERTMTNEKGAFEFANVPVYGSYRVVCGDVEGTVKLSRRSTRSGRRVHIDLKNVRRSLNLRTSALWELADALDISEEKAIAVRDALAARKRLRSRTVETVLRAEGLDMKDLKARAVLRFSAPRPRRLAR